MANVMDSVARQGSFASWLLAELVERKKLPADLARALGARPSTVSSWTNPKKPVTPNPYYAVAIAKFLGVDAGDVLRLAGHEPTQSLSAASEANSPEQTGAILARLDELEKLAECRLL